MKLPPPMYGEAPVRWFVELDSEGNFLGFTPRGGDTKSNRRGESLMVPTIVRAAGIKPKLLADNGEYVLGIGRPGAKPDKVAERHRQFIDLVRRCAEDTGEPSVNAVVNFLERWSSDDTDLLPDDFDPADNLAFRVGSVIPTDLSRVQAFWASQTSGEKNPVMTCLVTGEVGPVVQRMPVKVKGLTGIGGQASGTSLVSANASAFESYGLDNSLTSPISRDAGERFGKALNHLLASERSRIYVGPTVYAFWTREESDFDFAGFLREPDPQSVKRLLDSPRTGQEQYGVRPNDFYVLALSASGGRAVVRDWLETTVPRARENLKRWFIAQRIVNAWGEAAGPMGVYSLAASAYRDANKEMVPTVPAALVRAALTGGHLPEDLLVRAVRRTRAEGDVSRPRATLMKLVLSYGRGGEELTGTLEKLDREHPEAAYHCGRLLAELEALQRAAIPGVKATIVDRYYGSASSTPASVFGTLMRNHQAHIGKLRKERPGVGAAIQDRIGEIAEKIGPVFPSTLSMREQAVFALGYYHQRAHNRAEARAARETREQSNKEES
ncbi:MAG: type I-C CRISPR-associated protein Cas8c/Csd1 [Actinomycetota bacterium]